MSRSKSIIAIAAASVLLLAGCSSSNDSFAGITPTCDAFKGGAEIDQVKVTGADGKVPTVEFPTKGDGTSQLSLIKTSQTKVVKEGSGPTFTGNQLVTIEYVIVNSAGYVQNSQIQIVNPGFYANTPVLTPSSGNAVFTITMGGRANRTQYETLVAAGSITGNGAVII